MPFTFQYALHEMLQQRSYNFSPVISYILTKGMWCTPFDLLYIFPYRETLMKSGSG